MLTIYPDLGKRKRSRPVAKGRRRVFCLGFILAVALVVLPWPGEWLDGVFRSIPTRSPERVLIKNGSILENEACGIGLRYFKVLRPNVRNARYLTVIDYTMPSSARRLFLIDLESGTVEKYLVAHGKSSGGVHATSFSNQPESFRSSKGFFATGRKYKGIKGTALQLHGLERGVNDNALARGIVMHGAGYVNARAVMLNGGRLGRSLGCPAVPAEAADSIIDRIKGGSLLYVHAR